MARISNSAQVEIKILTEKISRLENEIEYLRTHPTIVQGLRGERFVCELTNGQATAYAEKFDVELENSLTIEVKFSKLNIPVKGEKTLRWNWSKPLGQYDKGKEYDFLVLLGEKDDRYMQQYYEGVYVAFLIPKSAVGELMSAGKSVGGMIQINTNLNTARAPKSRQIKEHMVPLSSINQLAEHMVPLSSINQLASRAKLVDSADA